MKAFTPTQYKIAKNLQIEQTPDFRHFTNMVNSGGSRIFPGGGGGAPTPKVGTRTYFFGRKLHENERILAPRGGRARPWRPPLDPPLVKMKLAISLLMPVHDS